MAIEALKSSPQLAC